MHTTSRNDELTAMRRELDELRAEITRMRRGSGVGPEVDETASGETPRSRRLLFRGAAAAGAGLAVATIASRPALAADNDPILIGNANTGTSNTSLSTTALEGLRATTDNTTDFSTGVVGETTGASGFVFGVIGSAPNSPNGRGVRGGGNIGVEGITTDTNGEGVRGFAFNPGATGVIAISDGTTGTGIGSDSRCPSPDGIAAKVTNSATTGPALGVSAESASTTGTAVLGAATSSGTGGAIGVRGTAATVFGIGVDGRNDRTDGSGIGVRGTSQSPIGQGVFGVATSGIGVLGVAEEAGGLGAQFRGPRAALFIQSSGTAAPQLLTDAHTAGEIQLDDDDNLWVCVVSGTPGSWRLIAGPGSAGTVNVVEPYRAYDSRFTDGPLRASESLVVSVKDAIDVADGDVVQTDAIPDGATAIFFNITVANTVGSGFLATTPGDAATFGSSSVNWSASGVAVANGTLVKLDDSRQLKVFAGGGTGAEANVIIDVTGFTI